MNSNSGKSEGRSAEPRIAPVSAEVRRPLWSVMIPTFNCARYLRDTLESVLAQDPGPDQMQIEVVDDCSDIDNPAEVVNEIGGDRVSFHKKSVNEGAVRNFNTCLELSRGHLIHILHGDDFVEMGFYREIGAAFEASPECAAVFCRAFDIREDRDLLGLSNFCQSLRDASDNARELMMSNPMRTPGAVVRRCFYERYGGFDTSLVHVADWDMWVRAIVYGRARMLNRALASFRISDTSDTSRRRRSAEDLRDCLRFSEKKHAEGIEGFDRVAFNRELIRDSYAQVRHFRRLGDHDAVRANYSFFYENSNLRRRGQIYLELILRKLSYLVRGSV
jgi:glycosyltransferase involved in cell wall biosynthesis